MRRKLGILSVVPGSLWLALGLAAVLLMPRAARSAGRSMTVTVGPADADVIGTDNIAIQKAIDLAAAAGGGTVVIKAGTYLACQFCARGEPHPAYR